MQARAGQGVDQRIGARGEGKKSLRVVRPRLVASRGQRSGGSRQGRPHLDDVGKTLLFSRQVVRWSLGQIRAKRGEVRSRGRHDYRGDHNRQQKSPEPPRHDR